MSEVIAIVGLGYVGLPLAVAFGAKRRTIGFDLNEKKLEAYRAGVDPSGEIDNRQFNQANLLEFSSDPSSLSEASVIIIVVPTPIDGARRPDLKPLESASKTVGRHMSAGVTVIYESTVYPGCTEEVCVPILEDESGLTWRGRNDGKAAGFSVGYSPERINPGDKQHRLETITKVVAGDSPDSLEQIASLYESVVDAGVYRAPSIKVAEAAKVIENTQRDLNIALMNELAVIFNRLDIDTLDVLEAAGTKWNFLPFRPGLVGGHCIGVDPYYLTYKAQSVGLHPKVVLGGRQINDAMGKFIAEQTVKQLAARGHAIAGSNVAVLGLTFKENCSDIRNSKVEDVVRELESYSSNVFVHDPLAKPEEAKAEYGITLAEIDEVPECAAVILAVPHAYYLENIFSLLERCLAPDGLVVDVKGVVDRTEAANRNIALWRL